MELCLNSKHPGGQVIAPFSPSCGDAPAHQILPSTAVISSLNVEVVEDRKRILLYEFPAWLDNIAHQFREDLVGLR